MHCGLDNPIPVYSENLIIQDLYTVELDNPTPIQWELENPAPIQWELNNPAPVQWELENPAPVQWELDNPRCIYSVTVYGTCICVRL